MNRKFLFLANVLVILFSTAIVSCGDDDDDNFGGGDSSPVKNVSADLKPFIGYYMDIVTNNGGTFEFPNYKNAFFFTDKKCRISQNNEGAKILDWNYNPSTKVLSVENILHAQWSITATTDNAWSGFSIWATNQQEYTARKDTVQSSVFYYLLENFTWKSDTLSIDCKSYKDFSIYDQNRKYLYNINLSGTYKTERTISYDAKADALVFTQVEWIGRKEDNNIRTTVDDEVRIVHPYSYVNGYVDVKLNYIAKANDGSEREVTKNFSGRFRHE